MTAQIPDSSAPTATASIADADATMAAARHVAALFRWTTRVGLALVVVGATGELATQGALSTGIMPPGELAAGLMALSPNAVITLGLLVFLVGPALGLATLSGSYLASRDRRSALVALLVLVIVLMSIPIESWLRGLH